MSLPFLTIYKGDESKRVFLVDADVFFAHGWSLDRQPSPVATQPEAPPELSPFDLRKAELEALLKQSWQKIAAIAKPLGIEKPEGGWDEAISLILEAEDLSE
jgi:hypothetical protein